MTNKDSLIRFIFEKASIRGQIIYLDESFQAIINQHAYPPLLSHLLGEALCIAGLLSAIIKFSGRLTVQFQGKGKLKLLLAQCNNQLHLRGLAKFEKNFSDDQLLESFHDGLLVIMLDSDANGQHYQGIVSWQGDSLVESIEEYFRKSEQLATKVCVTIRQGRAAALLLQVIPKGKEKYIHMENETVSQQWNHILKLTERLNTDDLLNLDSQTFLTQLYPEEEIRIFKPQLVSFHCTCSRNRSRNAILILGQKEAEAELSENKSIVVTCDFCNKTYHFDRVDVAEIFENENKKPPDKHLH